MARAPVPIEWLSIADTNRRRSIALLQHTDDALPDRYQVRDNDSALWLFGDGQITTTPIRFSLSLVASTDPAAVSERVAFIARVIH